MTDELVSIQNERQAADQPPGKLTRRRSLPLRLRLITVGVLLLALWGLAQAWQINYLWDYVADKLVVSPYYLLISGVAWGFLWIGLFIGLVNGWPRAYRLAPALFIAYAAYIWMDRLLAPGYSDRPLNSPFLFWFTLALLSSAFLILNTSKVRQFFGEPDVTTPSRPSKSDDPSEPGANAG